MKSYLKHKLKEQCSIDKGLLAALFIFKRNPEYGILPKWEHFVVVQKEDLSVQEVCSCTDVSEFAKSICSDIITSGLKRKGHRKNNSNLSIRLEKIEPNLVPQNDKDAKAKILQDGFFSGDSFFQLDAAVIASGMKYPGILMKAHLNKIEDATEDTKEKSRRWCCLKERFKSIVSCGFARTGVIAVLSNNTNCTVTWKFLSICEKEERFTIASTSTVSSSSEVVDVGIASNLLTYAKDVDDDRFRKSFIFDHLPVQRVSEYTSKMFPCEFRQKESNDNQTGDASQSIRSNSLKRILDQAAVNIRNDRSLCDKIDVIRARGFSSITQNS